MDQGIFIELTADIVAPQVANTRPLLRRTWQISRFEWIPSCRGRLS